MSDYGKKCRLCKRHNDYFQTLTYCQSESCNSWIHKYCYKSEFTDLEKGWFCSLHKLSNNIERPPENMGESSKSVIEKLKCLKCSKDIDDEKYKTCQVCNKCKHDICTSKNEKKSCKEGTNKIVCDDCLYDIARKSIENIDKDSDDSNSSDSSSSDSDSDEENKKEFVTKRNKKQESKISSKEYFYQLSVKDLPKVTDADLSWTVFYSTYKDTKHLFSDHVNVVRLQKAIVDERVKRIGGKTLFNPKTYDQCLKSIDKRLKNNFNELYKEASDLENHFPLKNHQKAKIIEYIDKLRNFDTLAKACEEKSYTENKKFLAKIANVLPNFLKNPWEKKQAKLERKRKDVNLGKLIKLLDSYIPALELSIRNDAFVGSKKEDKDKKKGDKMRFFHVTSDRPKEANQRNLHKCWFHKNDTHSFNKCKDLWKMDGRMVTDLARKNGICTYCGLDWQSHKNCPSMNKLKCNIEGCTFPHHSLFCYKRKINDNSDKTKSSVSNNHKHNVKSNKKTDKAKNKTAKDQIQSDSESEGESLMKDLSKSINYTNTSNIPAHSSKDTRFSKPFRSNMHLVIHTNVFNKSCRNLMSQSDNILLGVLVLKINNRKMALLIDSGSSASLIEESVADALHLNGPLCPIELKWSGNQSRKDSHSRIVQVEACGMTSNSTKKLYFHTVSDLKISPQRFVANEFYAKYRYLIPMDLFDYEEIHGVIGIDNKYVFRPLQYFYDRINEDSPFDGVRCLLGDYVFGTTYPLKRLYDELQNESGTNYTGRFGHVNYELTEQEHNELQEMETEVMGIEYQQPIDEHDRQIAEEVIALQKLESETRKLPNSEHYIAPLLWKHDDINLDTQDSYKVSMRRYLIVEKQALKLEKFDECINQVKNLISKGYARELTKDEIKQTSKKSFYSPIFFIHPPNKRTRMIWDLASKVNGKSLNDFLVAGPNLYNNLLEIIFQMRERPFLFKGDLAEMFHQIFVNDDDTEALRFLFRFDPNEKIRVFKMLVLPFGAKCSPTISQFVKNLIALEHTSKFPKSCKAILNNSYVDDIVKSVDTLKEAQKLPLQIKRILYTGGFNMLKINSNSDEVIEYMKNKLTENELANEKLFSDEKTEKLLGYEINFKTDSLSINLNFAKFPESIITGKENPNKRQILQIMMSVFDPVGFMQFVTSKLKILYHRICMEKYEWDQLLSDELNLIWINCLNWLKGISSISIPRLYCNLISNAKEIQLWAFGDSGKEIACGVLYLRFLNEEKCQLGYRMMHAKTFVTPIKQKRTIPELELNVSYRICEMVNDVKKMHSIKFDKIIYATDNAAVKEWITNSPKKPTTYVKNRIDKIHKLSDKKDWIWLPTEYMAADYGTKLTSMPEMTYENEWFEPLLFRLPEENWPEFRANKTETEYQINIHNMNRATEDDDDEEDHDYFYAGNFQSLSYLRIISIGQRLLRRLYICRNNKKLVEIQKLHIVLDNDQHNPELKQEIKKLKDDYKERDNKILSDNFKFDYLETLFYKKAQANVYKLEIKMLENQKTLPKSNKLFKLSPFLDYNNVIRVSTRLGLNQHNIENFGYDRICPILLPKNHPLTTRIILRYHQNSKHALSNTVVVNLMKKFYIPHIKWYVKQVIKSHCFICRYKSAKPQIPQMGDLPAVRLAHHQPAFTHAICDLAGPIIVNVHRNITDKRYIFVYSCLTTRAIHLELIEKMDADSTLIALTNTINLRGAPKSITSDNGLNFKGAKNILDDAEAKWNKILMDKGVITSPIEWSFGPPRSPHSQGSVERMVGLTKYMLKKITDIMESRKKLFNDFLLRAILIEIVGILNNRPLSLIPIDGTETEIITPNYFLIGRQNIQTLSSDIISKKTFKESYEDLKIITNIIWNHWVKAYLPTILMREKWIERKTPLKVDDLVLTIDTVVINSWRLGKIVEVIIGSKNQARQYKVLLGKNCSLPDIKKLTKNQILDLYKNERYSIVTRSANSVAKINIDAIKN